VPDVRPTKSLYQEIRNLPYLLSNPCFRGAAAGRRQIQLVDGWPTFVTSLKKIKPKQINGENNGIE
jgi:hypothetical protein